MPNSRNRWRLKKKGSDGGKKKDPRQKWLQTKRKKPRGKQQRKRAEHFKRERSNSPMPKVPRQKWLKKCKQTRRGGKQQREWAKRERSLSPMPKGPRQKWLKKCKNTRRGGKQQRKQCEHFRARFEAWKQEKKRKRDQEWSDWWYETPDPDPRDDEEAWGPWRPKENFTLKTRRPDDLPEKMLSGMQTAKTAKKFFPSDSTVQEEEEVLEEVLEEVPEEVPATSTPTSESAVAPSNIFLTPDSDSLAKQVSTVSTAEITELVPSRIFLTPDSLPKQVSTVSTAQTAEDILLYLKKQIMAKPKPKPPPYMKVVPPRTDRNQVIPPRAWHHRVVPPRKGRLPLKPTCDDFTVTKAETADSADQEVFEEILLEEPEGC